MMPHSALENIEDVLCVVESGAVDEKRIGMNILESSEAHSFFKGVLKIEKRDEGWMPQRLTERQLEYYAASEGWKIRSQCAAGIILKLRTDSPWLDLEFECLGGARNHLGLDVEVNGQVIHSVRREHFEGTFRERLLDFSDMPCKIRNIIVYFPCSMIVLLKNVDIAEDSGFNTMTIAPKHLLCLGDSITQGMGSISPLSTYAMQLALMLDAELINQGIGGHTFDVNSLDPPHAFMPHLITVAYGTNDWSSGIGKEEITQKAFTYIGKLQDIFPGVPMYVISPVWRNIWKERKGDGLNLDEFGALIRHSAREFKGVGTVNGFRMIPHQDMYFKDGTHPNELGFMHYATNLYRAVR